MRYKGRKIKKKTKEKVITHTSYIYKNKEIKKVRKEKSRITGQQDMMSIIFYRDAIITAVRCLLLHATINYYYQLVTF